MPNYTRDQLKFLALVDAADADVILQIINDDRIPEPEKENYIVSLGSSMGQQMLEDYRRWRDSCPKPPSNANTTNPYPFLVGVADAATVTVVIEILNYGMPEEEKDNTLRGILDPAVFQSYLQWKTSKNTDSFLNLLPDVIRGMAVTKLNDGKLDELEVLVGGNPQAKEAFQRWVSTQHGVPQVQQQTPGKKAFVLKVEIPPQCLAQPWSQKFSKWCRQFGVRLDMVDEGHTRSVIVTGEPPKVLDCVIECYGFMQKSMPFLQYLPDYLEKMVRTKWDRQKRISFMKKTATDIWITEENGNNVAKLNAFSQEELNAAMSQLKEEFDILMLRENKNSSPAPIGRSPAQSQTQLSSPTPPLRVRKVNYSRYPDTMNILILGESGVGKTTLINSIANYAFYETFADANQGKLHILIDSFMEMYDQEGNRSYVRVEPTVGNTQNLDNPRPPSSSDTQHTTSYFLEYQCGTISKKIRIIDTPGISDTRGLAKDKENMQNILDHLKNITELHAILILMKPNEDKLNIPIKFCLKELFNQLHVDAAKVINFCFTRGIATNFRPAETRNILNVLLDEVRRLQKVTIPLNNDTMYTFENHGLNTLCSLKKGYSVSPFVLERSTVSWQHSAQETQRLFTKILSNQSHQLEQTFVVNRVRDVINALARPMAQVARQQLVNKRLIREKLEEIELCKGEVLRLEGRLNITQTVLRAVEIDRPQTVCTARKCTTYKQIGENPNSDEWPINNSICHPDCHLRNIAVVQVPHEGLKNCAAFGLHGITECSNCGCGWETHQHIKFRIEAHEAMIIDKNVANQAQTHEQLAAAAEAMVKELKAKDDELTRNNQQLLRVGADFAVFLKNQALLNHNDAYLEYIYKAIDDEEEKERFTSVRSNLLTELNQFRDEYVQVVKLVTENMSTRTPLSVEEIEQQIRTLKNHPHYGEFLREAENMETRGAIFAEQAEETRIVSNRPFTFMKE